MELNAVLPLASLVLGAVMTYAGSWLNERAKWKRDLASRWDERCLLAVSEFATAVKTEARLCVRMASGLGLGPTTEPLSLGAGLPRLEQAEDHRAAKFELLRLLADGPTIQTAQEWQGRVWLLHRYCSHSPDAPKSGFNDEYRAVGEARDSFYRAARLNLGIPDDLNEPRPVGAQQLF